MSRLREVAASAVDTLALAADDLAAVELSAVLAPPAHESLAERNVRREAAVSRLGEIRVALTAARAQLLRELEWDADSTTARDAAADVRRAFARTAADERAVRSELKATRALLSADGDDS